MALGFWRLLLLLWRCLWYTLCLKNVPPSVCYNFDIRERILIFFGRNVTDKVSNQKTLYCVLHQITCTSALSGKTGKHENRIFSLKCCISALPEFNQLLFDFFSIFDSRLILTLLYQQRKYESWAKNTEEGSGEPLDRSGGKTKHRLICYFHSNNSAKNYRNRIV